MKKIATITTTNESFNIYYDEMLGSITRFPNSPGSGWPMESYEEALNLVRIFYSKIGDLTCTMYVDY